MLNPTHTRCPNPLPAFAKDRVDPSQSDKDGGTALHMALVLASFADSALCWINLLASQASEAHVKYEMQLCPGHPRPGNNTSFMCCMVCNLRRCSASSLPKTKTRTVNCLDFFKKSCLDPTRSFRVMCSRPARLGSFARLGPEGARSRVKSSWLSIL